MPQHTVPNRVTICPTLKHATGTSYNVYWPLKITGNTLGDTNSQWLFPFYANYVMFWSPFPIGAEHSSTNDIIIYIKYLFVHPLPTPSNYSKSRSPEMTTINLGLPIKNSQIKIKVKAIKNKLRKLFPSFWVVPRTAHMVVHHQMSAYAESECRHFPTAWCCCYSL